MKGLAAADPFLLQILFLLTKARFSLILNNRNADTQSVFL